MLKTHFLKFNLLVTFVLVSSCSFETYSSYGKKFAKKEPSVIDLASSEEYGPERHRAGIEKRSIAPSKSNVLVEPSQSYAKKKNHTVF